MMKPRERPCQIGHFCALILGLLTLASCEGQVMDAQLETADLDQAGATESSLSVPPNPR
jgi:hypothetical protein